MAIHPIDLQTMYSQMNNIAKNVANQQQGPQLTQQLQQNNQIRNDAVKATIVHKADNTDSKSGGVNSDGHSSQEGQSFSQKNEDENKEDQTPKRKGLYESYLGQHIDITG